MNLRSAQAHGMLCPVRLNIVLAAGRWVEKFGKKELVLMFDIGLNQEYAVFWRWSKKCSIIPSLQHA